MRAKRCPSLSLVATRVEVYRRRQLRRRTGNSGLNRRLRDYICRPMILASTAFTVNSAWLNKRHRDASGVINNGNIIYHHNDNAETLAPIGTSLNGWLISWRRRLIYWHTLRGEKWASMRLLATI